MSLKLTIEAVAAIVGAIDGIGNAYPFRRAVQTEADFNNLYVVDGKVKGWDVTRETTGSADKTIGAVEDRHLLVIRGYLGVKDADATEQTFQESIETVRHALLSNRNLSGAVLETSPVQARLVGTAAFGPQQVLVHYCELTLQAVEFPVSTM